MKMLMHVFPSRSSAQNAIKSLESPVMFALYDKEDCESQHPATGFYSVSIYSFGLIPQKFSYNECIEEMSKAEIGSWVIIADLNVVISAFIVAGYEIVDH